MGILKALPSFSREEIFGAGLNVDTYIPTTHLRGKYCIRLKCNLDTMFTMGGHFHQASTDGNNDKMSSPNDHCISQENDMSKVNQTNAVTERKVISRAQSMLEGHFVTKAIVKAN